VFSWIDLPDLRGRTVVVTGANSGLGLQTAKAMAGAGATTVMTARSRAKYDEAAGEILPLNRRADLRFVELDLADLSSVRSAAEEIAEAHETIDVLINNAGVMFTPERETPDGLELQMATNHFGPFALTGRLLGRLLAAERPRIVTVSSGLSRNGSMDFDDLHQQHRDGYDPVAQYARSKLANLLFMLELQRRADAADVPLRSVAAHPGYTATNLQTAGASLPGGGAFHRLARVFQPITNRLVAMDVRQGALPQVYAAVGDVPGGSYWGPQGPGEMRGPVGPADLPAQARDPATAARLWEVSVETTGVDYHELVGADASA
jgi:protochlorophyllide reductase